MKENQMTVPTTSSLAPADDGGQIHALLTLAVEKGIGVEGLEKLVALQERVMDRRASEEFADAMARFQAECPPIRKNRRANIATKSGASYGYDYATLDEIDRTVKPITGPLGLSYTWDSKVADGLLTCVCNLRHRNGHAVSASFTCPVGDSGRMSAAQEGGAALTYARRQALVSVLGLTSCDPDDDAAPREPAASDGPVITEEQAANLQALAEEVGADRPKFLAWLGVERLAQCPVHKHAAAYMGRSTRDFRRLLTKPAEWERPASDHLAGSFHYVGAGETRRARAWTTGDLDRAKELLRPEPYRPKGGTR